MNPRHKELAAGRWYQLPFVDQMANIGGEVERALNWGARHNNVYSQQAVERAFELLDLTLAGGGNFARLKELARLREALADYFLGSNEFVSTEDSWRKYFLNFSYAARRNR